MVFYFSGTGNSLYIAKRIAAGCNDTVVSIPDCVLHDRYSFSVKEGESVGFVFPVIACAPPDLVTKFIKRLQFPAGKPQYLYSVFNCAGSPEYTSRIMKETSKKAGIPIQGFFSVLMPGNYITKKRHLPQEKVKHSFFLSYVVHKLAVLEKNEPFVFGDACIGCGKCAAICPMEAITLRDGRPTRDQANCAFCLGCVNVCPTHALQVGKKTQGNPQYINPHYDGKARK